MAKKKIGVLGGTFDPPHKGHLEISKFFIKKLKLSCLIWAITLKNPFKKKPSLSLNQRIILSKKLTNLNKKIKIISYDKKLKSSETINLIKFLKKNKKKDQYYFLMGSDNLVNLHKWKKWREIKKFCRIAVYPRRGYVAKSLNSLAFKTLGLKNIVILKSKMFNISSSKLRKNYLK